MYEQLEKDKAATIKDSRRTKYCNDPASLFLGSCCAIYLSSLPLSFPPLPPNSMLLLTQSTPIFLLCVPSWSALPSATLKKGGKGGREEGNEDPLFGFILFFVLLESLQYFVRVQFPWRACFSARIANRLHGFGIPSCIV